MFDKYVCRGSLGVGEGATRDLRRYVVVARAKSNSRGSKRREPAKKFSLSVCVPTVCLEWNELPEFSGFFMETNFRNLDLTFFLRHRSAFELCRRGEIRWRQSTIMYVR